MPDLRSLRSRTVAVTTACSLAIFLAQGCVFASLGLALEAMRTALGWHAEVTGNAFSVMVVACCVSAGLPARLIAWCGGRATMTGGMVVLAASFAATSLATTPIRLYGAMALIGCGFSLVANAPALYLIASWSGPRTAHHIGIYLTAAAIGSALVPPLAQAALAQGWVVWWHASAVAALLLAAALYALLRNPVSAADERATGLKVPWGRAYALLVSIMVLSQTAMLTVSSVAPPQLAVHGFSAWSIAAILGGVGLVGALATAQAGWLTQHITVLRLLVVALLAQGLGTLALAVIGVSTPAMATGFMIGFGLGVPLVTFAVTLLLVEWFGRDGGTAGLGFIWTAAGAGAIGPWTAGISAEAFSGHGVALAVNGCVLIAAAQGVLAARKVTKRQSAAPDVARIN